VFGRKERRERIAREREEIEKRKAIGQQLRSALLESPLSLKKIQTIVEACHGALSFAGSMGRLALHTACENKAPLNVVRWLVQECPESLKVTDSNGSLPLHCACANGSGASLDVVRYLVKNKYTFPP
jgi:hypothetical protein